MNAHNKGKGAALHFLQEHLGHEGDECLVWPFFRDPQNGRGRGGANGELFWAHRKMCEMVNGPAPTPDHEAAHSCGNGDGGCVHPKHLDWKTPSENQMDRREHGTAGKGIGMPRFRLTHDQVARIREIGSTKTQAELAAIYGTSWQNIGMILRGEIWKNGGIKSARLSKEQIADIKSSTLKTAQLADQYGLNWHAIWRIRKGHSFKHIAPSPRALVHTE